MAMISGTQASLVISPATINTAQKSSANMVSAMEAGEPMPKGSVKVDDLAANRISFCTPCGIINPPKVSRSSSKENEMELSVYFELKSFFIGIDVLVFAILGKVHVS